MVHCGERWVEMWKKHPEFCDKSRTYSAYIEYWINLCDQIIARGFDPGIVYEKFPEGAARIIKEEKDDKLHEKALNYVCECLKRDEAITSTDLKKSIAVWSGKVKTTPNKPAASLSELTPCSGDKSVSNETKLTPDHEVRSKTLPVITNEHDHEPAPTPPAPAAEHAGKQSPFKTGTQVKAHDADPLNVNRTEPEGPVKAAREEMEDLADRLMDLMPPRTQRATASLMADHPSWKYKDLIYFAIDALLERENTKAVRK